MCGGTLRPFLLLASLHHQLHFRVLHVNVQVDRESPEGKAQGDAAANAIANIMGAAYDEPILRESVNWVEADDGAGTAISQSQVRAS